ncbi:Uncharacterised protein [Starkeya nomas]|uniref:Uncharacterized protein n=1 Tax=Starkeya nomas TaxID=2666134 RepID=A0A5S9R521_9HYPH|nr:Uncharacterised protein [Starkeya nomas]
MGGEKLAAPFTQRAGQRGANGVLGADLVDEAPVAVVRQRLGTEQLLAFDPRVHAGRGDEKIGLVVDLAVVIGDRARHPDDTAGGLVFRAPVGTAARPVALGEQCRHHGRGRPGEDRIVRSVEDREATDRRVDRVEIAPIVATQALRPLEGRLPVEVRAVDDADTKHAACDGHRGERDGIGDRPGGHLAGGAVAVTNDGAGDGPGDADAGIVDAHTDDLAALDDTGAGGHDERPGRSEDRGRLGVAGALRRHGGGRGADEIVVGVSGGKDQAGTHAGARPGVE